jgi:hypothetical protein
VLNIFYLLSRMAEFRAQRNATMDRESTGRKQTMAGIPPARLGEKQIRPATIFLTALLAMAWAILPAMAQQGTSERPVANTEYSSEMQTMPASTAADSAAAPASAAPGAPLGPPTVPIEEIVKRFAAREEDFKIERDNYTYTQKVSIQTLDSDGRPDGEYKQTSEIVFTPERKRYEHVTYAPVSTLNRIMLTQQDFDDLEHVQPFVLTTSELPKYNITYVDHVPLDELTTYVFDVAPKTIEKNQRYFQGRIWVDDKDFEIVKTDGKAVPDIKRHGQENVFPRFETFRENVEGNYWFPTYTRSNDVLHFDNGDIPIRMTVRYENYKRFGVTVKIGKPAEKTK